MPSGVLWDRNDYLTPVINSNDLNLVFTLGHLWASLLMPSGDNRDRFSISSSYQCSTVGIFPLNNNDGFYLSHTHDKFL